MIVSSDLDNSFPVGLIMSEHDPLLYSGGHVSHLLFSSHYAFRWDILALNFPSGSLGMFTSKYAIVRHSEQLDDLVQPSP